MASNNNINKFATSLLIDDAGSDVYVQFSKSGTGEWRLGVDDTDSDAFVLSQGSALGTNNVMRFDSTGIINFPLQPSFLAYADAQANVTGDGTDYQALFANEVIDTNGDFASSTFTAPITGRYRLSAMLTCEDCNSAGATSTVIQINTSNRKYWYDVDGSALANASDVATLLVAALADMDASDTATVQFIGTNGTKTVDIAAGASSSFSGYLFC